MARARSLIGTLLLAGAFMVSTGMLGTACGGGGGEGGAKESVEITFEGTNDLFPTLNYGTGLQPAGSPVQASFTVSAKGTQKVRATATPSGSKSAATISGIPGSGSLALDGGFFMIGQLKVDLANLSYDGPIPGIENIEIPIKGEAKFDPFSIDKPVSVHADIPPSKLPGIPLPAPIPGQLVFEVAEGSTVDLTFTGKCAGSDGSTATYDGTIDRAGTLVIKPVIEIDVPLLGTQSYEIPSFSLDLALGASAVAMSAPITQFGSKPAAGDHVTGSCSPVGTGGMGTGGMGTGGSTGSTGSTGTTGSITTGSTGSTMSCTSDNDCGGLPCLDGQCSPGGGVCQTGFSYSDDVIDMCISQDCCDELDACLANGAQSCMDCINNNGPACKAYTSCAEPCFGSICNSGVAFPFDPNLAACLSASCCTEFNACTSNGTQTQACTDCFNAGGGPGTVCEDAIVCGQTSCGL